MRITRAISCVVAAVFIFATAATAEEVTVTNVGDDTQIDLEVRPLITIPSTGKAADAPIGFGVGSEFELGQGWFATGEIDFAQLRATADKRRQLEGSADAVGDTYEPTGTRTDLETFTFLGGVRYYTTPTAHSWYADGKLGYELAAMSYTYEGTKIEETSHAIPLLFEGGYRWAFEEELSLRFGARGGEVSRVSRSITTREKGDMEDQAKDDVKKNSHPNLTTSMIMGLGFKF